MMSDLKHIRHFSFDLWCTLIKSNPSFKKERSLYFFKHFNTLHMPISEVEAVFREIDLMCNAINEKTGKHIVAEELYLMVIYRLNGATLPFQDIDLAKLSSEMENLLFNFLPAVCNDQVFDCLDMIKERPGTTLNILSNTAFIKGSTLKKVLKHLGLMPYFDFHIYSDEVGVSKPNIKMFRILLDTVYQIRHSEGIGLNEIIHIGDNPVADISGARSVGINARQVYADDKFLTDILN